MDKKENSTLEEIKKDVKEILELVKNPKKEIGNERKYNQNYNQKKEFVLKHPNDPMTQGQRNFLEKNEYQGDMDLTQIEASTIISAFINKGEQQ